MPLRKESGGSEHEEQKKAAVFFTSGLEEKEARENLEVLGKRRKRG